MKNLYLLVLLFCFGGLVAQTAPFTSLPTPPERGLFQPGAQPDRATYHELASPAALGRLLAKAPRQNEAQTGSDVLLDLPSPTGQTHTFRIVQYQMVTSELAARYPGLVIAEGWDVNAPHRSIALTWTVQGLRASVLGGSEGRWYLEPAFRGDQGVYQSYRTADVPGLEEEYTCTFSADPGLIDELQSLAATTKSVGDCQLREYRLALACTAEYFNQIAGIGYNGTAPPAPTAANEATVTAEMMTAIARVNQIFKRDLAIQLNIINLPTANGVKLVYGGDTLADPYSDFDGGAMLDENQAEVDAEIGTANYDIGHVFSTGGGGIAQLNSPCDDDGKARGVTGLPNPVGDPFYIDYVAHEIGHQFGGTHTFNSFEENCAQRQPSTSYEPGGGTTIQAYAGICGPTANVQINSDPYYHAGSIRQISAYMELGGGASCATVTSTANTAPAVTAEGEEYTIPTNVPFVLNSAANDGDGEGLTYCWEQFDPGSSPVAGIPSGFELDGPLFRSFPPVAETDRYFPSLANVIDGSGSEWEVLPRVDREMKFVVTVRDGATGGYGCTVQDEIDVTVVNTNEQYGVTAPNGGESWIAGAPQMVTWDVAGTDMNGINCTDVEIMVSTDGGFTYDISLGTFPNSGNANVMAPAATSVTARVMVRCDGNIFYDISDDNFSIEQTDYALSAAEPNSTTCIGNPTYEVQVDALQGYVGTVNLTATGLPGGVNATIAPASVTFTAGGATVETVTVTLMGANTLAPNSYGFEVEGNDGGASKDIALTFDVDGDFALFTPTDGEVIPDENDGSTVLVINHEAVAGATSYTLFLAGFNPIPLGNSPGQNLSLNLGNRPDGESRNLFVQANPGGEITCTAEVTFGEAVPMGASLSQTGSPIDICEGSETDQQYIVIFSDGDLTGPADIEVTSSPPGLIVNLSVSSLSDGDATLVTLDGEENLAAGQYTITLTADDGVDTETIDLVLNLEENAVIFIEPADLETEVMLNPNAQCGPNGQFAQLIFDIEPYDGPGVAESYTIQVSIGNGNFPPIDITPGTQEVANYCANEGDIFTYVATANLAGGGTATSCTGRITARTMLPVEWLAFAAQPEGKGVNLTWSVEQDAAHAGFTIERSINTGANWSKIARVARIGANGFAEYDFTDFNVAPATTYNYRLRQEDLDGTTDYSPIRTVKLDGTTSLQVYPNPITNNLTIDLGAGAGAVENGEYVLLTALGQIVRQGRVSGIRTELQLFDLPTGMYQLVVTRGADYREVKRIIKR